MLRLIFARHGQSTANLEERFSNRGWKHPLTEKGRLQARNLAAQLLPENVRHIYSSPIMRAVQTSEILASVLDAPFTVTEALREYDVGDYEDSTANEGWMLKQEVEAAWFAWQDYSRSMPNGESFLDIRARFVPFIDTLIQRNQNNAGTFLLVGHGGLYTAMLPEILANIHRSFVLEHPLSNTGYVTAEWMPGGTLICKSWQAQGPEMDDNKACSRFMDDWVTNHESNLND